MKELFDKLVSSGVNEQDMASLENITIHLMGGNEKAENRIEEFKKQSDSAEDLLALIFKEVCFDSLADLFKSLQNSNNLKDTFNIIAEFAEAHAKNDTFIESINLISELPSDISQSIKSNAISKLGLDKDNYIEEIQKKYLYTSKEKIAEEFDVNKRTLNKWLKHFFKDKYDGKKKIYFKDYKEIFETLVGISISGEKQVNLAKIKTRIKKGMSYNKSDISYLTTSDLKTQKDNLKNIEPYHFMDVFPYSLAKIFVEKMGSEIEF